VGVGVPPPSEALGVGVGSVVVAPPPSEEVPLEPEGVPASGVVDGVGVAVGEVGESSRDFEVDGSWPVTASLTVVPPPPLKLSPDTSS
jgi:hypothetical protein